VLGWCVALGLGLGMLLGAVACEPPPIRCRVDDDCPPEWKCDVRQSRCIGEGEYIESHPDAGALPADAGGGVDAGETPDAGDDAGILEDAGMTEDAGTEDAGMTEDAGTEDAGTTEDAGVDAGMLPCGGACPAGQFCDGMMCQPCNTSARCGATCMACTGSTPHCSGTACVQCTASGQCPITTPCCQATTNTCTTAITGCL
jgi:hypothetical protein